MSPNKLNDLDSKRWLKFQKSWFIHNPPPRKKGVLVHPAKFPETLAQEFIEFFTKQGETVLDPMAGTGSTLVAALRAGRNSYGIELNPKYAEIAKQIVEEERNILGEKIESLTSKVIHGDAAKAADLGLSTFSKYLQGTETCIVREGLPNHHRKECKKGWKDLSTGVGYCARAWKNIYTEG